MIPQSQVIKIKDRINPLSRLFREWRGAKVLVQRSAPDTILLKRIQPSDFWDTWKTLRKVSKNIADKDIANALKAARAKI